MTEKIEIPVAKTIGRFCFYNAKVGTLGSNLIAVKKHRTFYIGQRIEFFEYNSHITPSHYPKWQTGRIWDIADQRIFIER